MKWYQRKNGISVLIPCQNEEALISLCIRSFLEFGDELIVVDNGSIDNTKDIVRSLAKEYPEKIKFFDRPDLPDLYHNRQFAFTQSSYRFVVRADSDYVAYTDGPYDIKKFRKRILRTPRLPIPAVYAVRQANISGDFWHTGFEREKIPPLDSPGRYIPPPVTPSMLRIYEVFPGFRFQQFGRGEGVRFTRFLRYIRRPVRDPIWMHCNLKSDLNYFLRSERRDWRELNDFSRFPTIEDYAKSVIYKKYGTHNIEEAARIYMETNVYPFLQKYDADKYYAYPKLLREAMAQEKGYRIINQKDLVRRIYSPPY